MGHAFIETRIAAPLAICFDLARDVDAHTRTASFSAERAVEPGRTSGLLELGDLVTFEGVHFGIRQRFTAKITELDRPHRFVDELVKSRFRSLHHIHDFLDDGHGGTIMRDILTWRSPLGVLGTIADKLFIERHMRSFVTRKQLALKSIAEEMAADTRSSTS